MGAIPHENLLETRVVILDHEHGPEVDIVEIPYPATVGAMFEHAGRLWEVLAHRERTRVLIATESGRCSAAAVQV